MDIRIHILLYFLLLFGLIPTSPTKSVISKRKYCGYQHSDDYNRQNDEISIDEFPWMVQLLYNNESKSMCSGSVINNLYVLTAAHCLQYAELSAVRLGDYNVTTSKDCIQNHQGEVECTDLAEEFGLEELIIHPSYNPNSLQHDIALIRLTKPVTFSDFIRPICLPETDSLRLNDIQNLSTSGWGLLGMNLKQTQIKKRILTNLVPIEECSKTVGSLYHVPISVDQICGRQYESFSCAGDSGAPLMYSVKNQWEQVGVVSFGKCGKDSFTVYGKVFNYLDWIASTIRP